MVNPIIAFTADITEPDIYNDVNGLPDPFTMNILNGITNTHTATLYFKASLVSPPASYTASSTNLGSLAAGQSGFFIFTPERHLPTLTGGEYDETITFRIDAYTDSGYTAAYANQTLSVNIHHFDHADAAWTVIEHADFNYDLCGWTRAGVYYYEIVNDHFYSSPGSVAVSYNGYGSSSYGPGYVEKNITVGGTYSKARFVCHIYRDDAADDDIEIKLGSIVKKGRTLPLPNQTWCRLSWNMPINTTTLAHFWCNGRTYLYPHYHLDEVWVIAK
jgi:hypothetical protein